MIFFQKMSQRNVLGWALRGASCGTIVLSPNPCVHPSVSTGITCVFFSEVSQVFHNPPLFSVPSCPDQCEYLMTLKVFA